MSVILIVIAPDSEASINFLRAMEEKVELEKLGEQNIVDLPLPAKMMFKQIGASLNIPLQNLESSGSVALLKTKDKN